LLRYLPFYASFQNAPIILLTGPTGAGKTATIHVLAKELGIEVQEWSNPVVTSTYLTKEQFQHNLSGVYIFNNLTAFD
jgi:cell cycle checkpoint protein